MERMEYVGKFDRWQDLLKYGLTVAGNVADCYVKEHRGYARYIYDGSNWRIMKYPESECSLSEQGKCLVIDKGRILGKGWVLIIDEKPNGLEIGGKIRCNNDDMIYTVNGFGGLSNMKQLELLLSPNDTINTKINIGDILQVLNK